jgi:hypothetical protein
LGKVKEKKLKGGKLHEERLGIVALLTNILFAKCVCIDIDILGIVSTIKGILVIHVFESQHYT